MHSITAWDAALDLFPESWSATGWCRLGSPVSSARDCKVGGPGSNPRPDKHSGSLSN